MEGQLEAIFVSYRRSDAQGQAGRLFQNLVEVFGRDAVLLDVAGLEKGRDFRKSIERRLQACKVMLVMIGPAWAGAKADDGSLRLHDPGDLVRIEIAAALRRDIPVIPVLVAGAAMPPASALPDDLKDLVFRDGVELTHARWDSDVRLLVDALRPYLGAGTPTVASAPPPRDPVPAVAAPSANAGSPATRWAIAVAVLGLLGVGGWLVYQRQPDARAVDATALAQPASAASAQPPPQTPRGADTGAVQAPADAAPGRGAAAASGPGVAAAPPAATQRPVATPAATPGTAPPDAAQQGAATPRGDAPGSDGVNRLSVIADTAGGADIGIAYQLTDDGASREAAVATLVLCLKQDGRKVAGTTCMMRTALPGNKRVMMALRFADGTAPSLKGKGLAQLEACLRLPGEPKADAARCRSLDW